MVHVPASIDSPAGKSGDTPQSALVSKALGELVQSVLYNSTALPLNNAETMSRSSSPSISATNALRAPFADELTIISVHVGSMAPSFSHIAMVLSLSTAETISRSPSPSISAICTP